MKKSKVISIICLSSVFLVLALTLILASGNLQDKNIPAKAKCMQNATHEKNFCYKEAKKIYSDCLKNWSSQKNKINKTERASFMMSLKECRNKSKEKQQICKDNFHNASNKCKNITNQNSKNITNENKNITDENPKNISNNSSYENPENYSCPPKGYVNCMPIIAEDMQKYCNRDYRIWAIKNCDVEFAD